MSDYRYACVYWRYHSKNVDFDGELEPLVRSNRYSEEMGEQSTQGFYELTDSGWEQIDVSEIERLIEEQEERDDEARRNARVERPFRVNIQGPDGTTAWQSSHATRAEAETAAAALPAALAPTISKDRP